MPGLPAGLLEAMRSAPGLRLRPGEPLSRHTSLRVGGPAELLVVPETRAELAQVLAAAAGHGVRVTMFGGGSNVLVGDGGVPGVVVKLGRGFATIEWEEGDGSTVGVRAGAATQLGQLARASVARGLAGLEYAEGIPGTVGGALFMNAGAYGGDVAAVVRTVEGVERGGRLAELGRDAIGFGYRSTHLPSGFVVTAVRFLLHREDTAAVVARLEAARRGRLSTQPSGAANAGSMFKNPGGDHAGRLIEAAGLKGSRAGRARISERHANFIVNEGGARAVDVKALMDLAQRVVWERDGVWLEPEVRLVGSW
jgi:UDP-N-acetylmuramate dehydrogenase